MRKLRLAEAQHVAWRQLRTSFRQLLRDNTASDDATREALYAFDALPYSGHCKDASWLPTHEELSCAERGLLPVFVPHGLDHTSLLHEVAAVSAAERAPLLAAIQGGCSDDAKITLHGGRMQTVERKGAGGLPLLVRGNRVRWLRRAHDACSPPAGNTRADAERQEQSFRRRLYAMLARYDALAGGLAGAGTQAAVPPGVIDALEDWSNVPRGAAVEAFASPLNHRLTPVLLPTDAEVVARRAPPGHGRRRGESARLPFAPWFCTAFDDVDAPFGGRGDFFELAALPAGRLESIERHPPHTTTTTAAELPTAAPVLPVLINPPYLPWAMARLTPHLEQLLTGPPAPPAIALVIVPARAERSESAAPHAAALARSPLLRGHASFEAEEHAFTQGHAHRRGKPMHDFRTSRWRSDVYVLANVEVGRVRCEALLAAVGDAFRIVPPGERGGAADDGHGDGDREGDARTSSARRGDSQKARNTRRYFSLPRKE